MKKIIILSSLVISAVLLDSCTIHKRQHLRGYYVCWNKNPKNIKEQVETNKNVVSEQVNSDENSKYISLNSVKEETLIIEDKTQVNKDVVTEISSDLNSEIKENVSAKLVHVDVKNDSKKITKSQNSKSFFKKKVNNLENEKVKVSGFSIASLVCGILALFTTLIGSIIFGLLALIFGLIAFHKIRANPNTLKGKGMAWAGYICGLVAILFWSLVL